MRRRNLGFAAFLIETNPISFIGSKRGDAFLILGGKTKIRKNFAH
jgi:hypothetical protein